MSNLSVTQGRKSPNDWFAYQKEIKKNVHFFLFKPEQLSVAISAVISDNGEPIEEKIGYTTGTPERPCGGELLWWLNGHELYDKICVSFT
jgi:hypothetical protein